MLLLNTICWREERRFFVEKEHEGKKGSHHMCVCGMWYVVCGMCYVLCGMWYVVCGMWYVLCVMCDVLCVMWYVKGRFSKGILFWEVKERKWDTVRIGTALDTYHVLIRQGHVTQKAKNKTIKSKYQCSKKKGICDYLDDERPLLFYVELRLWRIDLFGFRKLKFINEMCMRLISFSFPMFNNTKPSLASRPCSRNMSLSSRSRAIILCVSFMNNN